MRQAKEYWGPMLHELATKDDRFVVQSDVLTGKKKFDPKRSGLCFVIRNHNLNRVWEVVVEHKPCARSWTLRIDGQTTSIGVVFEPQDSCVFCSSEMLLIQVCWEFGKLLCQRGCQRKPGNNEQAVQPVLCGLGPKCLLARARRSTPLSAISQVNANGGLTVGWNRFVNLRRAPGAKYNWCQT